MTERLWLCVEGSNVRPELERQQQLLRSLTVHMACTLLACYLLGSGNNFVWGQGSALQLDSSSWSSAPPALAAAWPRLAC